MTAEEPFDGHCLSKDEQAAEIISDAIRGAHTSIEGLCVYLKAVRKAEAAQRERAEKAEAKLDQAERIVEQLNRLIRQG